MKAIPIEFVLKQYDALTATAAVLPAGDLRDALVLRATHLMDLLEGWRARERRDEKPSPRQGTAP